MEGFVDAFERGIRICITAIAAAMILVRGACMLLRWMDRMDWILIPTDESVKAADQALLRMVRDVQAVMEPQKKIVVEEEAKRQDQVDTDDAGGASPPGGNPVR